MGNRGSKSNSNLFVKEQRLNGSWCINQLLIHLRCILKYFERNYLIKNLSKQLNKFSSLNSSLMRSERFAVNSPFLVSNLSHSQKLLTNLNSRRSYAISTLSNGIESSKSTLHPWFIEGFTDGEGYFHGHGTSKL